MILEYKEFVNNLIKPLYHFTTIYNLYKILEFYKEKNELQLIPPTSGIKNLSFTRNFNMKSTELRVDKRCVRLTVDFNKLNNIYKIKPYLDTRYKDDSEREERVYLNSNHDYTLLNKSIIRIDILKEPVFDDSLYGNLRSYLFEPNEYVDDYDEIKIKYKEYLNKIINLNITDIPIFIIDKYKPATFIYNK
jgi:hypothetical protein